MVWCVSGFIRETWPLDPSSWANSTVARWIKRFNEFDWSMANDLFTGVHSYRMVNTFTLDSAVLNLVVGGC